MATPNATMIYQFRKNGDAAPIEEAAGYIDSDGTIFRLRMREGIAVGRVDAELHIMQKTQFGERLAGQALATGAVRSAGMLEGGDVGWMDPDGVVIQGGMILGEEEVGRVEGEQALAAAAALLLIFLPAEAESNRRAMR